MGLSIAALLALAGDLLPYGVPPLMTDYRLTSPNGLLSVKISTPARGVFTTPSWSATFRERPILSRCKLSLELAGIGDVFSGHRKVSVKSRSVDEKVRVLFGKAEVARNRFNESRLTFVGPGGIRTDAVFRAFDDAVAFRYEIQRQRGLDAIIVADEGTSFTLEGDPTSYVQYLEHHKTSHEHNVSTTPFDGIKRDTLIDLPATFAFSGGPYLSITEAALRNYAGMSLMLPSGTATNELSCKLTPRADGTKVVRETPMKTPWRVILVGDRAAALLESNTVYCLNEPSAIKDTSWIKPGKMTWPWWNGYLFETTRIEPALSFSEARNYIDFCAANGIAFHSVVATETDTPWYFQTQEGVYPGPDTDVTRLRPGFDLPGIREYAKSKGVRLWTWVHQAALRGKVEQAFAAFEKMGWNGMMVDFFDHDDQDTVEHAEEILQAAAKHHIAIHFHGIWKPTGIQRTYPNLMNHEGALNLEYLKWGDACPPEHDLLMAFTRLVAGPVDYHLGGFRAVKRADFKPIYIGPNVLGTRCHQLALYICFDNPQPMVADYPAAYIGQPGFEFIRDVPTWWDETRVIVGEIGRTLVTARRKGKVWYLGGVAAGPARDLEVPLAFLSTGRYRATVWKDAPESEQDPNRLAIDTFPAASKDVMRVRLSSDGGFVAKFERIRQPESVTPSTRGRSLTRRAPRR